MAQRGESESCPGDQNDSVWNGDDLIQPFAPKKIIWDIRSDSSGHSPPEFQISQKVDTSPPFWGQPVPVLSYPLGVSPFPYVQLVAWQLALVFFMRTSGRGLHWWEVNKTSSKRKRKMVTLPQFVSQGDISVFYPRRISHQAEISHELPIAVPKPHHHVGVLHPKSKCLNSFIFSFQLSFLCID